MVEELVVVMVVEETVEELVVGMVERVVEEEVVEVEEDPWPLDGTQTHYGHAGCQEPLGAGLLE